MIIAVPPSVAYLWLNNVLQRRHQLLMEASYASPLPHVVIAPREARSDSGVYRGQYDFTTDAFTWNVPLWKKALAPYAGKPGVQYLEIGAFEGRSAIWMLENVLTDATARVTAIDIFAGPYKERYFKNIERSGSANKVTTLTGFSQVVLRGLPLDSFDIIYVDGSHMKNDVLEDAVLSWRLLKNGGLMIFDDYQDVARVEDGIECPKMAIDPFVQCFENKCEVLHNEWQLIIRKKG